MADLEVLQDAAVLIDGERIAWVGPRSEARDLHSAFRIPQSAIDVVEVAGVLFPGFVDCHTHAVFGGPRLDDHERRALGEDYKTVAARGGGILQSVRDVRARSEDDLVALTRARVRAVLASGSTTIQGKPGSGRSPRAIRSRSSFPPPWSFWDVAPRRRPGASSMREPRWRSRPISTQDHHPRSGCRWSWRSACRSSGCAMPKW